MLPALAVALGALIGFVASRALRRPERAAGAASVARSVGGTLGRRRGLSAPELQRACFSEMVRHVQVGADGTRVAPSRYELHLHPDDVEVVDEARGWFTDGLADALDAAAADNGWHLDGRADIRIETDDRRRPGVPAALAVDPAGSRRARPTGPPPEASEVAPAAAPGSPLALERTDTGERMPLGGGVLTIGRSADQRIVIDDTRVSRAHATVAAGRRGWAVTDAGSSNGTTVNGRLLTPNVARPLTAGDRIGIGPVELVVVAEGPSAPSVGTQALDKRDRTRISGQVLPPPRRPRP